MNNLVKQFQERSGHNYHQAEYIISVKNVYNLNESYFEEEYRSPCATSKFKWIFGMKFVDVPYAARCVMRMELTDGQHDPIKVEFTLALSNSSEENSPEEIPIFHFPETEVACGQVIYRNVAIGFSLLSVVILYDIKVCFTFTDCHGNKRELEVSPNSDEGCPRSAKQNKF